MQTRFFVAILLSIFLYSHVSCDRRFGSNLKDANLDFINTEGNKKPAPQQGNLNNPLLLNGNPTPAETPGVKTPPTTSTTLSGVKQTIKFYNDKNVPNTNPTTPGNGNIPSRQNSQGNKDSFPSLPTQNQKPVATVTPVGSHGSTKPLATTANKDFPTLPTSPTIVQPIPPKSWSSVVSGNKASTGGTNPPPSVVKSSADLKPIVPGADFPTIHDSKSTPPSVEVISDSELKTLSEALLRKENNNAGKYITLNYQGRTSSFSKDDLAPQPLVTIQQAAWEIPTIAAMKALLDNYEPDTTVNEHVTAQERTEENVFLDAIMATPVIRHLMTTLKEKNLVSPDPKEQKDVLKSIWFNMYSRGQGRIGSSGFEHIFLSELKNGEISGLHNWLYFSTQENAKNANYLGWMKKLDINDKQSVLKLHFSMNGIDKPVDTMFVGTSPELEVALYSLCFLTRADKACPLSLGGKEFNLRTHTFRYRSKNMIGSAFPEI